MANRPTAERFPVVPGRRAEFAHLSLGELRSYRAALGTEEGRVSYWRRIVQARLDLVRAAQLGVATAIEQVRAVFSEDGIALGRNALLTVMPADDMPPLPALHQLWGREPRAGDTDYNEALMRELALAERELSAYRTGLHRRLAAATGELIARYREDPRRCFVALPIREDATGAVRCHTPRAGDKRT